MRALALLVLSVLSLPTLAADVPRLLPHEGRVLRANGTPERGMTELVFSIYTTATGGSSAWSETQTVHLSPDGYYATHLGRISTLPALDAQNYWLGVAIVGEIEMAPRAQLASVPFAFRAGKAEDSARLGGDLSADILRLRQQASAATGAFFPVQGSAIPEDNTIPQISEGYQILSLPFTPVRADSRLQITAVVYYCEPSNVANGGVIAVFRDNIADALAVGAASIYGAELAPRSAVLNFTTPAGSTAARTYTLRVGATSPSSVAVNGCSSAVYGGSLLSTLTVLEISP